MFIIYKFQLYFYFLPIEFNHIVLEMPSLLHAAAVHQKNGVAQLLIDLGIDLNLRDAKGVFFNFIEPPFASLVFMVLRQSFVFSLKQEQISSDKITTGTHQFIGLF